MKLHLVIATAIAVYTADCQDFSKKPVGLGSDNKAQIFLEDIEGKGEEQNLVEGPNGNNMAANQDSDYDAYQMKEVKLVQNKIQLRRSRCKARNACVVMGGFCVTNATLCGGRLVSEGCKGTNCQCCVPGTIEANLVRLEEELDYFNDNMNNMSSALQTKLETVKGDMTNMNTNLNSKIDYLTSNINNMSSNLESFKINISNMISSLGCSNSDGFFKQGNQCFKLLTDFPRSWDAAKSRCNALDLVFAKPVNPVDVRNILLNKYGNKWTWLSGRGTGSKVEWDDGTTLSSTNSHWWPSDPGSKTSTSYCLRLNVHSSDKSRNPTKVLYMTSCSTSSHYALCEVA